MVSSVQFSSSFDNYAKMFGLVFFLTFFSKIIFKLSSFYHKLLGEMLDSNVAKPHVTVSLIILLNYDAFIFQISYF